MTNKQMQNLTNIGCILLVVLCVYFFSQGYFTNPQRLQYALSKAGILAPLLFICGSLTPFFRMHIQFSA